MSDSVADLIAVLDAAASDKGPIVVIGHRTELVPVVFGDSQGLVPRPSLLGAVVGNAVAVEVDDVPDAQRLDLALLLSLVKEPIEIASQLTKKDRRRLRARSISRLEGDRACPTVICNGN